MCPLRSYAWLKREYETKAAMTEKWAARGRAGRSRELILFLLCAFKALLLFK
jgi:hypothetical protein